MHPDYIEIRIVWNPDFRNGGPVSTESWIPTDGKLELVSLHNGFYTRSEAWRHARSIAENHPEHYLIVDSTTSNPYISD